MINAFKFIKPYIIVEIIVLFYLTMPISCITGDTVPYCTMHHNKCVKEMSDSMYEKYINEVVDYLKQCIATGKCSEINNNNNWILKLFYDNLNEMSDGELLIAICTMWDAFTNACTSRFEPKSEWSYANDVMHDYDYYFDFCMERKYKENAEFPYRRKHFIEIIHALGDYHYIFCDYVEKHKDVDIDSLNDLVKNNYIMNKNTLSRINECYEDRVNYRDYDDDYISSDIWDYIHYHHDEFTKYMDDFSAYDPDSPFFIDVMQECIDYPGDREFFGPGACSDCSDYSVCDEYSDCSDCSNHNVE